MTIRTAVAGAALALVLACGAAPAGAATVRVSGDTLEFRAAPGEVNLLSISRPAAQIVLRHRPGFAPPPISATGGGCTSSGTEAQCPAAGVTKLDIDLGDGDDQLDSALSVSLSGYSILKGGAGNDVMYGTGGDDDLYGGPGNDRLDGNDGADFIHGGDGSDWAVYDTSGPGSPVTASLDGLANDGAGGSLDDNVDPDKDVENLAGGEGDDLLTGDDSYNMLDGGGSGNDHLRGRGDSDVLDGGSGDDVLDGGEGTDGADYSHRAAPVTVDLEAGTAGEAGERDTLIDVNAVGGGSGNDPCEGRTPTTRSPAGGATTRSTAAVGATSSPAGTARTRSPPATASSTQSTAAPGSTPRSPTRTTSCTAASRRTFRAPATPRRRLLRRPPPNPRRATGPHRRSTPTASA